LELRTHAVGPWQTNAYVLICATTRQSVLIDPAAEPETLLEMLADSDPIAILLTHSHLDHVGVLDQMRTALQIPLMAHSAARTSQAERWLNHSDIVAVGKHALEVYHTPGHTGDMVCFSIVDDPRTIVGDAIFEGGPGHTFSPEGFRTTLQTLRNIILAWPDDTVCHPGHGVSFRLGDRRPDIEAFLAKDHRDFHGAATWDM
jgi:hydroxyacylglutathione hydrolase